MQPMLTGEAPASTDTPQVDAGALRPSDEMPFFSGDDRGAPSLPQLIAASGSERAACDRMHPSSRSRGSFRSRPPSGPAAEGVSR
jgi:hypothetical protein